MGNELVTAIRARIAALVAERTTKAQEAQRLDYGYAAAIGELERLLKVLEEDHPNE